MKRALLRILIFLGVLVVLVVAAYFYEQKWGVEGPFPNEHHHGGVPCNEDHAH